MPCRGEPMENLGEATKSIAALDAALERGLADADAGNVLEARDVFAELKARYAQIPVDRVQE